MEGKIAACPLRLCGGCRMLTAVYSVKFGEIAASAGLPWQNAWEVVVEKDGASRNEDGINILSITPEGLQKIGASAGGAPSKPSPPAAKPKPAAPKPAAAKASPAPSRPLSTQRVGMVRPHCLTRRCACSALQIAVVS